MRYLLAILLSAAILGSLFTSCENTPQSTSSNTTPSAVPLDTSYFLKKGGEIAALSFQALSTELKQALQRGGVAEAVQYCQLKAYPIVDSLSHIHQARIRRTTLKVRNPKDTPDEVEANILKRMQQQKAQGLMPQPVVQRITPDTVLFAAPILTQPLCLKCHGTVGKEIDPNDYALIQKHYPNDQATGYKAGDLRGMWSIRIYSPSN